MDLFGLEIPAWIVSTLILIVPALLVLPSIAG